MMKERTILVGLVMVLTVAATLGTSIVTSDGADLEIAVNGHLIFTHYGPMELSDLARSLPFSDLPPDDDHWIVQFDGPVGSDNVLCIEEAGGRVIEYLPDMAFVIERGDMTVKEIGHLPGAVGSSPFPVAMRTHPLYIDDLLSSGNGGYETYTVETFDEEAAERLARSYRDSRMASPTRVLIDPPFDGMELLRTEGVRWIEPRPEMVLMNDISSGIMDVQPVWDSLGLNGTGQIVAIADSGLDTGVDDHDTNGDIHLDFDNRAVIRNWAGTSPDDGHGHGTHVTGSVAGSGARSSGNIKGMAYNSSIVFQAIMNDYGSLITPGNLSLLFKEAYDLGARVHTNSWGSSGTVYQGAYTSEAQDVDWTMFHYPEMLILYAAGNDGIDVISPSGKVDPNSIGPPATSKSTLTVGASENLRSSGGSQTTWSAFGFGSAPISNDRISNNADGLAGFSSRGPTDDGRIKPDVVAPGTNILSTRSTLGVNTWGWYNTYYHYMGGTSMATPLTAGMAVLVRQYLTDVENLTDPLASTVKAAIMNGAVDLTPGQYGGGPTQEVNGRPDNDQGWGRASLEGAVSPVEGRSTFYQDRTGLRTGENVTRMVRVEAGSEFRVTMAWSDYPSATYAAKTLVNDLDLTVTAPDGTVYRGNDITYPYDNGRDSVNPNEGVNIDDPMTGWYRIEVTGYNVPLGRQHFSIAASGNITPFISTAIRFDRAYYSTDDSPIVIDLTAPELVGAGSITVTVNSTSDPTGRSVILMEMQEGLFRGSLLSSNVTTPVAGRLYLRHFDFIRVAYSNETHSIDCEDTAIAVSPLRAYLYDDKEYDLVFSSFDRIRIRVRSLTNSSLHWTLEGTGLPYMNLTDDGNPFYEDPVPGDGDYYGTAVIPSGTNLTSRILLRATDPYLGRLYYPQRSIRIDGSVPRFPRGLTAEPLDKGNSVMLRWELDNVSDRSYYQVYVNTTDSPPTMDPSFWRAIETAERSVSYREIDGLTDGVQYHFRIASIAGPENSSSSLSLWASAIPRDLISPDVMLLGKPRVISAVAIFEFQCDPDTKSIEMEFMIDSNLDGLANDPDGFHPAGSTETTILEWDTRGHAGGPGNVSSLILRYRALDEASNPSTWLTVAGFSVDNVPPGSLDLVQGIPPLTRRPDHTIQGSTEPSGMVLGTLNGAAFDPVRVSTEGNFYLTVDLEEGANHLVLRAYDVHGAGPRTMFLNSTLDTTPPEASIEDGLPEVVDISAGRVTFVSSSNDPGGSIHNAIDQTSWELRGPDNLVEIGTGPNFDAALTRLGEYRIRLTVTDIAGNKNQTNVFHLVIDESSPVAEIEGNMAVNEDTFVSFVPGGMIDNDPFIVNGDIGFEWHFSGVGGWERTVERRNASILFPDPGTYDVMLRVTDRAGNNDTAWQRIVVYDITPPDLFMEGPSNLYVNMSGSYSFEFNDNDPRFPDSANITWVLEFIDPVIDPPQGAWSVDPVFNFTFTRPGNYSLVLTVTDAAGNPSNSTLRIWVRDRTGFVRPARDDGIPWAVLIAIIAILVAGICLTLFIYIRNRPEISEIEWEDDPLWEDDE